jgi:osomolarity two-component system, response regulator SKN7
MNNKTSLENIRRKTPATRKQQQQQYAQIDDTPVPTQQLEMLHAQVVTSQQQIATLENRNVELQNANANLSREVVRLRDSARNHDRILQQIVNHLAQIEKQRRQSLTLSETPLSATADMVASSTALSAAPFTKRHSFSGVKDEPGQQYLLSAAMQLNRDSGLDGKEFDQLANQFQRDGSGNFISPPPDGRPFIGSTPVSAASSATLRLSDADSVVYPVGQTNGIDPSYGNANHAPIVSPSQKPSAKPCQVVPDWIRQPRILVVDDDAVCCGFGVKIANTLSCFVVDAVSWPRQCPVYC